MLSQQIKELEIDGLITKTIFAEMPPRVEYAITEKAKSLIPIFQQLNEWGKAEKLKNGIL
jgi:DNA-binding HxlR family transcriptional regulator